MLVVCLVNVYKSTSLQLFGTTRIFNFVFFFYFSFGYKLKVELLLNATKIPNQAETHFVQPIHWLGVM